MQSLVKNKITLCLYNKLTGDMTCKIHTFCKYIKFDMANFHTFLVACSRVFLQHKEGNLKDIMSKKKTRILPDMLDNSIKINQ